MNDLIKRLRNATEGSRGMDAEIALSAGWTVWQSKHGYWNLDGPNGERFSTIDSYREPRHCPDTGVENPKYGIPPWEDLADLAGLPLWTTSIDAALTLVPEGRHGNLRLGPDGRTDIFCFGVNLDCADYISDHLVPALAICIAALEAREA